MSVESRSAEFTAREGRRFAFPVGAAFLGIGALVLWRGHATPALALGVLGAALLSAGLVVPAHLGPVHRGWMATARAISRVTTPVVLAIFWFLLLTPFALLLRVFGRRPLDHAPDASTYWVPRPQGARRSDLRRQF